jgi:tRNA C32,U32 (ribose-2'-O)-methylase TrmJ
MSKKSSATKIVRKSAEEIPPASRADLDRLRAAMQGSIDTAEIPERRKFQRLQRDARRLIRWSFHTQEERANG